MRTLKEWIKKHEGFRRLAYKCSEGFNTVGWGRNIDTKGISLEEAEYLLDNDIAECKDELNRFSWYQKQPKGVKDALVNMAFNMGTPNLCNFKKMISALDKGDYQDAANEALSSRWSQQVGQRSVEIANLIRAGK